MTSPNLNYFIILGALFLYLSCMARVAPAANLFILSHLCRVSYSTIYYYVMHMQIHS